MPLSSVLGAQSLVRPGVCTSSTRPASPFEGQVIYETDTDLVQVYNGSGWKILGNLTSAQNGSILQVASTTLTTIWSASVASGATADITGLSASITPKSTSSKILVMVNMNGMTDVSGSYRPYISAQLKRGTTVIGGGTTAGSRTSISAAGGYTALPDLNTNISFSFLDSPSTTSSTTYQVAAFNAFGATYTLTVNQIAGDTNATSTGRPSSTITVMEIAG